MNREERVYSVTMTEEELKLFSEFLEQREYSKEEELKLKKLRYEDPDQYIKEVVKYRNKKRSGAGKKIAAGASIGIVGGLLESQADGDFVYDWSNYPQSCIGGLATRAAVTGSLGLGKHIYDNIKYRPEKTEKDINNVKEEKKLKKENPKEYERLKSEQKDTISVMEGKMTKKTFKEKHGHRPNTKI